MLVKVKVEWQVETCTAVAQREIVIFALAFLSLVVTMCVYFYTYNKGNESDDCLKSFLKTKVISMMSKLARTSGPDSREACWSRRIFECTKEAWGLLSFNERT